MRPIIWLFGLALFAALLSGGGAAEARSSSYDNWLFWWAYNRADLLGARGRPEDRKGPEMQKLVRDEVVPALRKVCLDRKHHPDMRGAAVIALARCPDGREHLDVMLDLADMRLESDKIVLEAAILAMGIAKPRKAEARKRLLSILADRKLPLRARGFTAVALGMIGPARADIREGLLLAAAEPGEKEDLRVCALLGLGLLGDEAVVPILLTSLSTGLIDDERLSDLGRSHVVAALGKIGDVRAYPATISAFDSGTLQTRRSAAIALGRLIPALPRGEVAKAVGRVIDRLETETDSRTVRFAILSLGRIASAPGVPEPARAACVERILAEFRAGDLVVARPHAALALGVAGMNAGRPLRTHLAGIIRVQVAGREDEPEARGALVLALGLLRDDRKETADLLLSIFNHPEFKAEGRRSRPRLRSFAALALGLSGVNRAGPALRDALEPIVDRDFVERTAFAAGGLLGRPEVEKMLTASVGRSAEPRFSQFAVGSSSLSLAEIGTAQSIRPLLALIAAGDHATACPELTRAIAIVGLGRMIDPRDERPMTQVISDVNYRATVPALDELLTIL